MGGLTRRRVRVRRGWWDCPCCNQNSYPLDTFDEAMASAWDHIQRWHAWELEVDQFQDIEVTTNG